MSVRRYLARWLAFPFETGGAAFRVRHFRYSPLTRSDQRGSLEQLSRSAGRCQHSDLDSDLGTANLAYGQVSCQAAA